MYKRDKFKKFFKTMKNKAGSAFVGTMVKVIIAVVIGAITLGGLYVVADNSMDSAKNKVSSLFEVQSIDSGSGGSVGSGTPVTPTKAPGAYNENGTLATSWNDIAGVSDTDYPMAFCSGQSWTELHFPDTVTEYIVDFNTSESGLKDIYLPKTTKKFDLSQVTFLTNWNSERINMHIDKTTDETVALLNETTTDCSHIGSICPGTEEEINELESSLQSNQNATRFYCNNGIVCVVYQY